MQFDQPQAQACSEDACGANDTPLTQSACLSLITLDDLQQLNALAAAITQKRLWWMNAKLLGAVDCVHVARYRDLQLRRQSRHCKGAPPPKGWSTSVRVDWSSEGLAHVYLHHCIGGLACTLVPCPPSMSAGECHFAVALEWLRFMQAGDAPCPALILHDNVCLDHM